jgi:FMN-dependent NADH-azoreductase
METRDAVGNGQNCLTTEQTMKLLHIDSSVLGSQSASRELSAAIVADWRRRQPGIDVAYRDLDADPLPHLSSRSMARDDPAERAAAAAVLAEFMAADLVVIGAPMYNFSIPSTLKAWIDRIAVAGTSFRYTADGPEGLAGGKRIIVASSRGGVHGEAGPMDFQESYLRALFGFLGTRPPEFVRAEGLASSARPREQVLREALSTLPLAA